MEVFITYEQMTRDLHAQFICFLKFFAMQQISVFVNKDN